MTLRTGWSYEPPRVDQQDASAVDLLLSMEAEQLREAAAQAQPYDRLSGGVKRAAKLLDRAATPPADTASRYRLAEAVGRLRSKLQARAHSPSRPSGSD